MDIYTVLFTTLGKPIVKHLLKVYLGSDVAAEIGGDLFSRLGQWFKSSADRHQAQRKFDDYAASVVQRLVPLFEHDTSSQFLNPEAVAIAMAQAVDGKIDAHFFVRQGLDPESLASAFRAAHTPVGFSEPESSLYERGLGELARLLISAAAELPEFQVATAAENLRLLHHAVSAIEESLAQLTAIRRTLDSADDAAQFAVDYRQALIQSLDYLHLFGQGLNPESRKHSLSVAYMSLGLQTDCDGAIAVSAAELLGDSNRGKRLLIRGEAGSGKSTLFRWIAMQAAAGSPAEHTGDGRQQSCPNSAELIPFREGRKMAAQRSPDPSAESYGAPALEQLDRNSPAWYTRIPFLIRLRDCEGGRLPPIDRFTHQEPTSHLRAAPRNWAANILRDGHGIVLIDGIDEVPPHHRDTVYREVEKLVTTYKDCQFLLSTRPAAVEDNWLKPLAFREAQINPLIGDDRDEFIDRWHKAVAQRIAECGQRAPDLKALAEQLKKQLRKHPPIALVASNPLLAAMICALHKDKNILPESQYKVLDELTTVLIHQRERDQQLKPVPADSPYGRLNENQKRRLAGDLAEYMVVNGVSVMPNATACGKIAEHLPRFFSDAKPEDATEVLRSLIERSGLLRAVGPRNEPDRLEFLHNTFKEFLAAERLVDENDPKTLASRITGDRHTDSGWEQVLLFAAASPRRKDLATELIRHLLPGKELTALRSRRGSPLDRPAYLRAVLAVRLDAVADEVEPEVRSAVQALRRALFPPATIADAKALSALGNAAIPFLRYSAGLKAASAYTSIRALRLIDTDEAREALEEYADVKSLQAARELALAINPMQVSAIVRALSSGADIPLPIRQRISDLGPLEKLTALQELNISITQVSDLGPLEKLTALQELNISGTQVSDLGPLEKLTALQELNISITQVRDLGPLEKLTALQWLNIDRTQVSDLDPLEKLTALQELNISGTQVRDLDPLEKLTALQRLDISGTQVRDLDPLEKLTALQWLNISGTQVRDLRPLEKLTALQWLNIRGTQVRDLGPLEKLTALQRLYISGTQVSDLGPLEKLTALQQLDISITRVSDLGPLEKLTALQQLDISETRVSDLGSLEHLPALRGLWVRGELAEADRLPSLLWGRVSVHRYSSPSRATKPCATP